MAVSTPLKGPLELPKLPIDHVDFIAYLGQHPDTPVAKLLDPFKTYEGKLREIFAQQPQHEALQKPPLNAVPIFKGHQHVLQVRARSLDDQSENEKYLMPLEHGVRKPQGAPAVVGSLQDFKKNFDLFSESSLVDLDWTNVVVAGSSVVTALLPVPEKYNGSKRAQREYYHQKLAPSSDVDLFIYGLDEEAAIQKMQQIETRIRDSILQETTTVRTKNAITIASQYPIRHVQIVLRLYKSVSEILTGFDVDCSCVAYDGSQVYGAPRAIAAFVTQTNTIDLMRRSPSYENRLSKYSRRGFEVYWPLLDRQKIDPTIFERSFARTLGLARLLVLERLPKPDDRENYLAQRRAERGRPAINTYYRTRHRLGGNLKDQDPDDVADWVYEDEASNYHSFTVPYGPKFDARKIEKLLYAKDILLNAEWALKKDRKDINLHRHPAFLGSLKDVLHDCCGDCPAPTTDEELDIAAEESKIYVSGKLCFMKDDSGRQAIGSFNPLTGEDWTDMAYIGNTTRLCQAIVDDDVNFVRDWCEKEGSSIDRRDYTGRTPLHLAAQSSTSEIVCCLIDHGARIVARLVDGTTALHIAAARGNTDMVKALLEKSEANEEEDSKNEEVRKAALKEATRKDEDSQMRDAADEQDTDIDIDDNMDDAGSNDLTTMTDGSFVKISSQADESAKGETIPEDEDEDPDVYDVNVLAWDSPVSPLHLAILNGHLEVIEVLVNNFGADVLLPVKLLDPYSRSASGAILTLVLAGEAAARTLLNLGASSAQADMKQISALHYNVALRRIGVLKMMFELDGPAAKSALNHVSVDGWQHRPDIDSPLTAAVRTGDAELVENILGLGAKPIIEFEDYVRSWKYKFEDNSNMLTFDNQQVQKSFKKDFQQPIVLAVQYDLPSVVQRLLDLGTDVNTLDMVGHQVIQDSWQRRYHTGMSLLDVVKKKIEDLETGLKEEDESGPAIVLGEASHYLGTKSPGSYQHWGILKNLEVARSVVSDLQRNQELQRTQDLEQTGIKEKKEALNQLHKDFKALRSVLLKEGAKTFKELHPEIEAVQDGDRHVSARSEPFDPSVNFQTLEGKRESYLRLFEAVWENDVATVKSMTLSVWGPSGENPPLQIAIRDSNNVSPFALAVYRGHNSLAKIILDIAQAQYRPRDTAETRIRYAIDSDSDEERDEDDQLNIRSELVDENFTIADIGALAGTIQSKTSALETLSWSTQIWRFSDKHEAEAKMDLHLASKGQIAQSSRWDSHRDPRSNFDRAWNDRVSVSESLLYYAIAKESKDLVKFLLECGSSNTISETSLDQKRFTVEARDWVFAIERGNPQILAELIKGTGAGMPLEYLAKQTGVEEEKKPEYYQGLKIHGKVRSDWAQEGARGRDGYRQHTESRNPPLLESSFRGSIASVEWFFSSAPLRMYREFALNHGNDQRVKTLLKAPGGFDKAISDWLEARSNLALHCAVMSPAQGNKSLELIKCILETLPQSIDVKSADGYTPLSLAFSLGRLDTAGALIAAGADQTTRDNSLKNLVHQIVHNIDNNAGVLRGFMQLIDRRLLKGMFLERCTDGPGAMTPLAYWLLNPQRAKVEILEIILEHSEGEDLLLMDRSGQLPLHQAIKAHSHQLAKVMIQHNPALLYRENAMGQTPLDLVESLYLHHRIDQPPQLSSRHHYREAIQDRQPRTFVAEADDQMQDKHDIVKTWKMCKEASSKSPGTRKLVSVMEANEVARRLAEKSEHERKEREKGEQEHSGGRSGRHENANEMGDEVSRWYSSAQPNS